MPDLSIILPAKNESDGLAELLGEIKSLYPHAELIVVNDGSADATGDIAEQYADVVVHHPYAIGNGAAVKSGARAARGDTLLFMDADGQHQPEDAALLLDMLARGFDMAIGARIAESHASLFRRWVNALYSRIASLMTGHRILDLTSGFRAVRADKFNLFLYLLPNGFSYPTTITMAFLRCGFSVGYAPIRARKRRGKSNIRPFRDGLRFFVIILKIGALYSPMRLFLPVSLMIFITALGYSGYVLIASGRFTNMGVVLVLASVIVFMLGILAEQVSVLHYRFSGDRRDNAKNKNYAPSSAKSDA